MKNFVIFFGLFLSLSWNLQAQEAEHINKKFDIGSSGTLSVKNSFGTVDVTPYDGSIIDVKIDITVVPSRERDLERIKDKIIVRATETDNRVELVTENNLKGVSTEMLEINYTIKIPKGTNLEIENSFGDVSINGGNGRLTLRVEHGDCRLANLGGSRHDIQVRFGDLRTSDLSGAEVEVQHGDIQADHWKDANLELQFGDADIVSLAGRVRMDIAHSDLNVEILTKSLTQLHIDAQFSDLHFESIEGRYGFDLQGEFTDFSWPDWAEVQTKDKEITEVHYKLSHPENPETVITVVAQHSDVDFED